MSRENVEVVQRVYEAARERDTEAVLRLYDHEVDLDFSRIPHATVVGRGLYHGHDGLRSWYADWYEAWESFEQVYEELIDAGEHVVSIVRQHGRGRASGAEVEIGRVAAVWTVREGRVVRMVAFPTRAEALEAVGLRE